jgi:hypothetical protein
MSFTNCPIGPTLDEKDHTMKKTIKAVALAATLSIISPAIIQAAPAPRTEWKDQSDNPVTRLVKSVKRFVVRVLAEPQSPPPAPSTPSTNP